MGYFKKTNNTNFGRKISLKTRKEVKEYHRKEGEVDIKTDKAKIVVANGSKKRELKKLNQLIVWLLVNV